MVSLLGDGQSQSAKKTGDGSLCCNYTDSWKDLLTEYNGQAITYDGAGNPLSYRDGMQFTWELGRQLKTASKNGKTYSFKYNHDGLRTQKTAGTVTTDFYWANGNMTYQYNGTNELYFRYDESGAPVSVNINGTDYYYVKNLQGDIIALLDGQGTCVVKYTYDAWGKVLEIEDSTETNAGTINPLRYRGYYYDSDLGFYYLRSRYYDPTVGRFLNADEVDYLGASGTVLSCNLFAYCENDGVNNSDYSGKTTYKSSYYHYSNRYVITTIITHNNNKYTYRYKAKKDDGTIQFYFSANNYGIALEKRLCKAFGKGNAEKGKRNKSEALV